MRLWFPHTCVFICLCVCESLFSWDFFVFLFWLVYALFLYPVVVKLPPKGIKQVVLKRSYANSATGKQFHLNLPESLFPFCCEIRADIFAVKYLL